jgi:hypothetical protein
MTDMNTFDLRKLGVIHEGCFNHQGGADNWTVDSSIFEAPFDPTLHVLDISIEPGSPVRVLVRGVEVPRLSAALRIAMQR